MDGQKRELCEVVLPERSLSCGVTNLKAMELACVFQKKFPCLFLVKAVNVVMTYVARETVFLFYYALVWQYSGVELPKDRRVTGNSVIVLSYM